MGRNNTRRRIFALTNWQRIIILRWNWRSKNFIDTKRSTSPWTLPVIWFKALYSCQQIRQLVCETWRRLHARHQKCKWKTEEPVWLDTRKTCWCQRVLYFLGRSYIWVQRFLLLRSGTVIVSAFRARAQENAWISLQSVLPQPRRRIREKS
jgi:hypothetical protein